MLEALFLDLDDTILDFHQAERVAVGKAFAALGLEPTPAVVDRYHVINQLYWQRLERGDLTREQVIVGRFDALFQELGVSIDPVACMELYEGLLAVGHYFLPGAKEALDTLRKNYRLFLASNGSADVQDARIKSAGLAPYFEQIFISQRVGANKPSPEFFRRCFAQIPNLCPDQAMMVGDSLTSDMRGGGNAGMVTCWINPQGHSRNPGIPVDYEIPDLAHLPALLQRL